MEDLKSSNCENSIKFFWFGTVLALCLLSIYFVFGNKIHEQETEDQSVGSFSVQNSDKTEYINRNYGFKLKYPSTFHLVELDNEIKFYDKRLFFRSEKEKQRSGIATIPNFIIHLYDNKVKDNITNKELGEIIKQRILKDGYSEPFFHYEGEVRIESNQFRLFRYGSLYSLGEFTIFNPDNKLLVGFAAPITIKSDSGMAIENKDVVSIFKSIVFNDVTNN